MFPEAVIPAKALQYWSTAFDTFVKDRRGVFNTDERSAVNVLEMQRLLYSAASNLSGDDQMLWDNYNAVMERIVVFAESIFGISAPRWPHPTTSPPSVHSAFIEPALNSPNPHFTLDISVVAPMYDIACRCRDPYIRRRALNVLRRSARQEGIYDGLLAAHIVENVIAIEEADLDEVRTCADVPDLARVSQVSRSFDTEQRKVSLRYYRKQIPGAGLRSPVFQVVDF